MEVCHFTFHPAEPMQTNESLAAVVNRRFVRLFSRTDALPFEKEKFTEGVHTLCLQDSTMQCIAVAVQPHNVSLFVRRLQRHGRSVYVVVNERGAIISGRGKRVYTVGNESERRHTGIVRRTAQGLALEHYFYVSDYF